MPEKRMTGRDWFDKLFVKSHGDWLREMVSTIVHEVMEAEVSAIAGAGYGERTSERSTHRNGYRDRQWSTRVGDIDLHIPNRVLKNSHPCSWT
jgi:transposase-like protein